MQRLPFYRGGIGMWSWLLHRATGVGVLLFLLLHILDTSLLAFGAGAYNHIVGLYRTPYLRVLEVLLAASVLYHALNGVRVTLIDFSELGTDRQRTIAYAVGGLFLVAMLPAAFLMVRPLFLGRMG